MSSFDRHLELYHSLVNTSLPEREEDFSWVRLAVFSKVVEAEEGSPSSPLDARTPLALAIEAWRPAMAISLIRSGVLAFHEDKEDEIPRSLGEHASDVIRALHDKRFGHGAVRMDEASIAKWEGLFSALTDTAATDPVTGLTGSHVVNMFLHPWRKERLPYARRLLEAGANPNVADTIGQTPLFGAMQDHYPEAVALLLDFGASMSHCDDKGRTPWLAMFSINHPRFKNRTQEDVISDGMECIETAISRGTTPDERTIQDMGLRLALHSSLPEEFPGQVMKDIRSRIAARERRQLSAALSPSPLPSCRSRSRM